MRGKFLCFFLLTASCFAQGLVGHDVANVYSGTFNGNGAGLTNIPLALQLSTNGSASRLTLNNGAVFSSPFGASAYGIQTNKGPGTYNFSGVEYYLGDTGGMAWQNQAGNNNWMSLGQNLATLTPENGVLRFYPLNAVQMNSPAQTEAVGSSANVYIPTVAGNASPMTGLPLHGTELWNAAPLPWVIIDTFQTQPPYTNNTTEFFITNQIQWWATSGMQFAFTNQSVPIAMEPDTGWRLQTRDGNGNLAVNLALFPSGFTNLGAFCQSHGFWFEPSIYYSSYASNLVDDTSQLFSIFVCTTPNTVQQDIAWLYNCHANAIRVADGSPQFDVANTSIGFRHQMLRQIADAVIFNTPLGNGLPGDNGWSNTMALDVFCTPSPNGSGFIPPDAPYQLNNWINDQGDPGGPNGSVDIGTPLYQARVTFTNYAKFAGRGHYFSVVYPSENGLGAGSSYRSIADLKGYLTMDAMFPGQWIFQTNPPTSSMSTWTNSNVIAIWRDWLCQPGFPAYDNGGNSTSCWVKPLIGGSYAVALANETAAPVAMVCNWSQMASPAGFQPVGTTSYPLAVNTNQWFDVYDSWASNDLGSFVGSFTQTVPAHSVLLYRLTPVPSVIIPLASGQNITNLNAGLYDPTVFYEKDDFFVTGGQSAGSSTTVGSLGFYIAGSGMPVSPSTTAGPNFPRMGIIQIGMGNATVAGAAAQWQPHYANSADSQPIERPDLGLTNWFTHYAFKVAATNGVSYTIGLVGGTSWGNAGPDQAGMSGAFLRYDTLCETQPKFGFVVRGATTSTNYLVGADTAWHDLKIFNLTGLTNIISCQLDSGAVVSVTNGLNNVSLGSQVTLLNRTGASGNGASVQLDFYDLYIKGISR